MSGPEKRPCRNARRKGCGLRGISPENREYGNGRPVFPFLGKTYLIDFHSSENHLSCQDSSGAETPLPEGRAGLFFRAAHAGKGPFFPCCAPWFRQGAETGLLPEKARAHGKTGVGAEISVRLRFFPGSFTASPEEWFVLFCRRGKRFRPRRPPDAAFSPTFGGTCRERSQGV